MFSDERKPDALLGMKLLSGGCALGWGAYVAVMPVTLENLPVYDGLSDYLSGGGWAAIGLIVGVFQLTVAILRMRWRGARWWRWVAAWAGLLWWYSLAISLIKSGVSAPATAVFAVLALANLPVIVMLLPGSRLCRRT